MTDVEATNLKVYLWDVAYHAGYGPLAVTIARSREEAREHLKRKICGIEPPPMYSYDIIKGPDRAFELEEFVLTVDYCAYWQKEESEGEEEE